MRRSHYAQVWQRDDGRWDIRVVARNGQIVLTSHNQGYERRRTAERVARRVAQGLTIE
jgi:uncharacterized protein YegP (UPF0339 family)